MLIIWYKPRELPLHFNKEVDTVSEAKLVLDTLKELEECKVSAGVLKEVSPLYGLTHRSDTDEQDEVEWSPDTLPGWREATTKLFPEINLVDSIDDLTLEQIREVEAALNYPGLALAETSDCPLYFKLYQIGTTTEVGHIWAKTVDEALELARRHYPLQQLYAMTAEPPAHFKFSESDEPYTGPKVKSQWHPFVATPNKGKCSSCGQSRSANIHRRPVDAN